MTRTSRAARRLALLTPALVGALTLSACGSDTQPLTAEQRTRPTATGTPGLPAAPTDSPTTTPTDTPSETVTQAPSSPRYQVIRIGSYAVSFELPKGWTNLDAKNVMEGRSNAFLDEFARRMGTTVDKVRASFANQTQTLSITDQGAVNGYLDNVVTVGEPNRHYNDDQLKLQMATIGAHMGSVRHARTAAGDLSRIDYTLSAAGTTVHGTYLGVFTNGGDFVSIVVSAHSADVAKAIGDHAQASLRSITPGPST